MTDQINNFFENSSNSPVSQDRNLLDALMAYIPLGVAIADAPDVCIRRVSRFGLQMLGRAEEALQVCGEQLPERWQIYHNDEQTLARPEELPIYRAIKDGDIIREEEWVLRTPAGEIKCVVCSAWPIYSTENRITGGFWLWRDISDRKQSLEAIRQYAEQLERSNRELQDFAFIASHDLQEPLRKIQSFGNLLVTELSSELGDHGRDYIKRMQEAAGRMQRMIEDLLSYSRVTTRALPFTRVELAQVVQEVLVDLEIALRESYGKVVVGNLPAIDADPVQMRQLFQNLIANALKFRREGIAPYVKISTEYPEPSVQALGSPGVVKIFIEDNGIGFNQEFVQRIFQPFQRLHGRTQYPGSGIGLAICQKIVARHGGSITARSEPGKGSVFITTLPLHQNQMEGIEG